MKNDIFSADFASEKAVVGEVKAPIKDFLKKIEADALLNEEQNAVAFAKDIHNHKYSDFEKDTDLMCHVSTFIRKENKIFVSYYANTSNGNENPNFQVARLAYCNVDTPEQKTVLDIQAAGDELCGHKVVGVYDTIIMQRLDEPQHIYVLWTANIDAKYYRLYRVFNIVTETLGSIGVNRFQVGEIINDFSSSGMKHALTENGIGFKDFFSDIGIMQKQSWHMENGENYCYSGTYSGNFTCIIKSRDLITWGYVSQPSFPNESKWENAVYVIDEKVYYFVRQWDPVYNDEGILTDGSPYGFLTYYDLGTKQWATPILVGDCQSRSDFILYKENLYLFYAPTNREHIGILQIDRSDFGNTQVVLQADMKGSCFYPFVQYLDENTLGLSYTVDRKHIRLAKFELDKYIKWEKEEN